jgi:hypothetical protein
MKALISVFLGLLLTASSYAGIFGWFTSQTQDWSFIQKTGGIRISSPIEKEGRKVLPVEYCVQGTVAITCQPTLVNSGMAVRKIVVKRSEARLVVCVVTQVISKDGDTGRLHYGDISRVPAGSYEVYYEPAGDPVKFLGHIEIK